MAALFFVVWCPQSDKPITTKYTSISQAVKVAKKMKEKYPENDFHPMVSLSDEVIAVFDTE